MSAVQISFEVLFTVAGHSSDSDLDNKDIYQESDKNIDFKVNCLV